MKQNKLEHYIEKKVGIAINRYHMIEGGDKVLVGVSGGKDSLTLLKILSERKKWIPVDYEIKAIHVISDYDPDPENKIKVLENFFKEIKCDYVFKEIKIKEKNKRKNLDCFWCSWNRRKAIFEFAEESGFKKIAFGHHKDDIVETILMNMFFNGEISSINPVQELFNGKLKILRPLVLLEEKEIEEYSKMAGFKIIHSKCQRNEDSKRMFVKKLIAKLEKENKDIKTNILKSPTRIKEDYLGA